MNHPLTLSLFEELCSLDEKTLSLSRRSVDSFPTIYGSLNNQASLGWQLHSADIRYSHVVGKEKRFKKKKKKKKKNLVTAKF
jgi:hypothetical protein